MKDCSVQSFWDRFEQWVYRYRKTCHQAIEDIFDCGYSDFDGGLFLCKPHELNLDIILDLNLTESDLYDRIAEKISLLRGYLVDISFDGPEFMYRHSRFLTSQYPSKCNNSIGIWFEQDLEGEVEVGEYFGFQGFDANLFCKSIEDIDLSSIRTVLPYNRMFVRRQKGQPWDTQSVTTVLQQIKDDLEFDYEVQMEPEWHESKELLLVNLNFLLNG
jgi:hypothetical protein